MLSDPYYLLGISYNASLSDIGHAYRVAALRHHPDKQNTEEEKRNHTPMFLAIKETYDTLADPVTGTKYERERLPELYQFKNSSRTGTRMAGHWMQRNMR